MVTTRQVGRHLDRAVDDAGLDLLQLVGHGVGHLVLEVVERSDADAVVLERADVRREVEAVLTRGHDGLVGRDLHVLQDRGEHDVLGVGVGLEEVGVDTDQRDVLAGVGDRGQRTLVDGATDRQDHVDVLVEELAGGVGRRLVGLEAAGEGAVLAVPADDLDVLALLLGVVLGALLEAVHEDRDGRERQAAVGADDTGLGVVGGQVAGQERRLSGVVEQRLDVGLVGLAVEGRAVVAAVSGVVDEDVLDVGVGGGRLLGRGGEREADGHDGVAALGDEALEVRAVVVLAVGLDAVELDAELVGGLLGALEAQLVERLVVEATRVGDDARLEVAGGGGLVAAVVASRSTALGRVAAAGQDCDREQGGEAARDGLPDSHMCLHVWVCSGPG